MATITRSACPRCNGRLARESDSIGEYLNCLMCGYVQEPKRLNAAVALAEAESYSLTREQLVA